MSKKKLIILGAGDLGREILFAAGQHNEKLTGGIDWDPVAFVDDNAQKCGTKLEGIDIIPFAELTKDMLDNYYFIAGVGIPRDREKMILTLHSLQAKAKIASVIHQSAVLMPSVQFDPGVYIGPHATVAIGAHIGLHTVLNFNVSVGHDCLIKPYSVISPGCILSGRTEIGQKTFLGSGVILYPGVRIGDECMLSAGVVEARGVKSGKKVILKPNTMQLDQ
jgi:sugar O-acyltransferase (sialic acid O-acetyltransferase NeuD family)